MGAPLKSINWELFEQLCALQCTQEEMSGLLKVDHKTLQKHVEKRWKTTYSLAYKRLSAPGKCSLRRYQFTQAKTNCSMAIWLGKQWLGQKEHDRDAQVPPNDALLELNYQLLAQIKSLNEQLNAAKSQANPVLSRVNSSD